MRKTVLALTMAFLLPLPICSLAAGYTAHVLSSWAADSFAFDINDSSQIVGTLNDSADNSDFQRAVVWNGYGAEPQLLPLPDQGRSSGGDLINNDGLVVGVVDIAGRAHDFLWGPGDGPADLGSPAYILAVNNSGSMVGMGAGAGGRGVPVSVDSAGQITYLDDLFGSGGEATGINDAGYIVGTCSLPEWGCHACLWYGGETIDIGAFGGTWSSAEAINNRNQVLGYYGNDAHGIASFIWTPEGNTIFIPTCPLLDEGSFGAVDINDNGVVLGGAKINGVDTVVTWSTDVGFTVVGPGQANAINNSGWIVGTTMLNASYQAMVWQPVPEPSSLLALLAGVGGFTATLKRRK